MIMCGIPMLIWFTVQYRDVKVSFISVSVSRRVGEGKGGHTPTPWKITNGYRFPKKYLYGPSTAPIP